MTKISTGVLSKEQHDQQNNVYQQNHEYDFVIIGTGMSSLVLGSLLADTGHRVCLLEAHDIPGGYAHTFEMNDFYFCAQVHYIWGCGPGQPIYEFLKKIGLEKEITFVPYDPQGYDVMSLPDGKRVKIPYGYENTIRNIETAYPGQKENLQKFFSILEELAQAITLLPDEGLPWKGLFTHPGQILKLSKYKSKSLQDVFDECNLSKEAQAILNANTGDLMCPPEKLSLFAYLGLFGGYNQGAYYPEKHFKFYVERLAQFITEHKGCHIYYETEVNSINVDRDKVTKVTTNDGKVFKALTYVCNMDPQKASRMIGQDKFPRNYLKKLSYEYSPSSLMVYLGVKDIDLFEYGFGNHNIWHLEQWDLNQSWRDIKNNRYDKPWMFFSTPTLHTRYGGVAPEGCQIIELGTAANYGYFKQLHDESPSEYRKQKRLLAERLLKIASEKFIPGLEKHMALKVIGSPVTNETFCYAPFGNCYGSDLSVENVGLDRLKEETPWSNLFWCNASSGYPSICGTTLTGVRLFEKLTNSKVYDSKKAPSTEEAIQYSTKLWKDSSHIIPSTSPSTL